MKREREHHNNTNALVKKFTTALKLVPMGMHTTHCTQCTEDAHCTWDAQRHCWMHTAHTTMPLGIEPSKPAPVCVNANKQNNQCKTVQRQRQLKASKGRQ